MAQAQALPEKFVAPFTLGAPKNCGCFPNRHCCRNECFRRGSVSESKAKLYFNPDINPALQSAVASYRPIQGKL